jgi:N-acyl-D-aspartate/D-glutamate deacylase
MASQGTRTKARVKARRGASALLAVAMSAMLLLAWSLAGSPKPQAAGVEVDVLLKGGEVYDGTGAKARRADVGIRGDRIVFVGDAAKAGVKAARTIDVSGLVVAPGFIDTHTHAGEDLASPEKKSNVNFLMQGVTTVVVGNDGGGTPNVAATLKKWEEQGIGTNGIQLVGFGAVRTQVLGRGDVQPTPEQLTQMRTLVRTAMEQGAYGLSTGLFYTPQNYSKTEEVIELAKVAAEMGGVYDSHLRDEDSYSIGVLGAIEEAIRIGREAKIHVNISHIKCLGPLVWGQSARAIEIIQKARKEGVSVTADQYPYTASGSNLVSSLLPSWAQAGRAPEVLARIKDPAQRTKIAAEMEENLKRRAGPDAILFRSKQSPHLLGKTLAQVSKEHNKPPIETALELITESYEKGGSGGLAIVSFNMNDKDVERFMKQDFVMTGSDGSAGHPRMYGTYPRKLRIYVREKKVISMARFVQASSGQPAAAFRVPERGQIHEGYFADVVALDAKTITDKATYTEPEILAEGMKFVLVNGKLAVENGAYTGALAGRALRKTR